MGAINKILGVSFVITGLYTSLEGPILTLPAIILYIMIMFYFLHHYLWGGLYSYIRASAITILFFIVLFTVLDWKFNISILVYLSRLLCAGFVTTIFVSRLMLDSVLIWTKRTGLLQWYPNIEEGLILYRNNTPTMIRELYDGVRYSPKYAKANFRLLSCVKWVKPQKLFRRFREKVYRLFLIVVILASRIPIIAENQHISLKLRRFDLLNLPSRRSSQTSLTVFLTAGILLLVLLHVNVHT